MLKILTDDETKQLILDKKIEDEGILIGWKFVDAKNPTRSLKKQVVIKYKNTKIMKFEKGNVLLCKMGGCYNPSISFNIWLCDNHSKGKILKIAFCTSKTVCTTRAYFGYIHNEPLFCKLHSEDDMIDVKNKKCQSPGCTRAASFSVLGKKAQFCAEHKDKNKNEKMINVSKKKCIDFGCDMIAYYGYQKDMIVKYCKIHQLEDMVNLKREKCSHEGCKIRPSFGTENNSKRYCETHKSKEMKDLVHKKCSFIGCEIRPNYGVKDGKAERCKEHMDFSMVDVTSKKCSYDECDTIPSFGVPGEQPVRCFTHQLEGMINVKNKRCIDDNCDVRPTFGFIKGIAIYCKEHKIDGTFDVKHKFCSFDGCNIRPSHGSLFSKIHNHCLDHSTLNEYSPSKRFPVCSILTCSNPATFVNNEDKLLQPIRCMNHKQDNDVEILEKICSSCSIKVYIPENRKICAECGQYRYKVIVRKEHDIKMFLKFNNINNRHNKTVHRDGSFKRPDFLIDSVFGKIILECDEFQHKDIKYNKEEKRMITIYNDIQLSSKGAEVLFIRYNPDNYKGIQFNTNDRLEYLHFLLKHYIKLEILGTKLGVIYLFYDEFDGTPKIKELSTD